jgi:hypothetical protein
MTQDEINLKPDETDLLTGHYYIIGQNNLIVCRGLLICLWGESYKEP